MSEFKEPEESYKFFKYADPEPGEEVVISGIAGRFPKSKNLYELKDNIFNRKDCVTDKGGKIGIGYTYAMYFIEQRKH